MISSGKYALQLRVLAGAAVLAAGFAAGRLWLPAGRLGALPAEGTFVVAFRDAARRQGISLAAGSPRVRLLTPGDENAAAHRLLGERASGWIDLHGHRLPVEVSHDAQWGAGAGRLTG